MANDAPPPSSVGDRRQRRLSITLPRAAELSPRSVSPGPVVPAEVCAPADLSDPRAGTFYSDHSERADPDAPDDTTPRTSFSSGTCTPPKQPRRASGRRPLSVMSLSSINSDASPLHLPRPPAGSSHDDAGPGSEHGPGEHGLGVSLGDPAHAPPPVHQTPEPYSPSKHRRHRSMIAAPIDYRAHYASPQYTQPLYVNYGQRPHASPSASPNLGAHYHPQFQPFGAGGYHNPCGGPHQQGLFGPLNGTYGAGAYPSPGHSPLFDSPMPPTPPYNMPPSPGDPRNDSIQDLFVAMAYHERQVLEARQNYEAKKEALKAFKRNIKAMIAPSHEPVSLPCRPSIISRRHHPNVGIHALAYAARPPRPPCPRPGLHIVTWRVDNEVSSAVDDEMCDDDGYGPELPPPHSDGVALRIVKCLLGVVHCIISTLPVYQRDFARSGMDTASARRHLLTWTAEYPLPMESLFGYLAYEA